ncbi:hypothetical protein HPP92_001213 [Vanilla planifolia]|uniref:Uncharacterized protein n=1 Tax=Vanilla planifolia TaxID=51239 RepID=A0A835VF51_VANPL|nr:hypothetical protein HPP92_001213 [Vanilla planifolia]
MSDNREIQEEQEAWSREENELIPRRGIHLHREGSEDETKQQQAKTTEDWYKGKRIKGEKKRFSHGNRRKMLKKVKQILLFPLRRLENHLGSSKEKISASSTRRCSYRFPYDGEEYGGKSRCH